MQPGTQGLFVTSCHIVAYLPTNALNIVQNLRIAYLYAAKKIPNALTYRVPVVQEGELGPYGIVSSPRIDLDQLTE